MMEAIWERISGWLVAALFAVTTAWMAMFRKKYSDKAREMIDSHSVIMGLVDNHRLQLTEHDKRIDVLSIHVDNVRSDLSDIKARIGNLHTRITESNKAVNDKLDRLLERHLDSKRG